MNATNEKTNYLGAHVGWKVARAFDAEARRRGKKKSWLIAKVLAVVAQDQLFDAVIDSNRNGGTTKGGKT